MEMCKGIDNLSYDLGVLMDLSKELEAFQAEV